MRAVLRWELRKLRAQVRVRALLLLCLLAPPLLAVLLSVQSGLPKDTLFGRHVRDSGAALPLLVLGFAGTWVLPLLTSLVAGDVFASEDGQRTWSMLLSRSRSRSQVFTGKVLAAAVSALALLSVLAASSVAAGLALAGPAPLTSLSGGQLQVGRATLLVLASWASTVPPLLGFTALACLVSVVSRSSVIGVGAPVVLGLLMQLLGLVGALGPTSGALLSTPFSAWHGLVREHAFYGPLWQGALVSLIWTTACLLPARTVLLRRDVL